MVLYHEQDMMVLPDDIGATDQVLGFSLCPQQFIPTTWIQVDTAIDTVQIALSALICILNAFPIIREFLQMYKATRRFQLNRYTNLLVKEGIAYLFMYVYIISSAFFSIRPAKLMTNCDEQHPGVRAQQRAHLHRSQPSVTI